MSSRQPKQSAFAKDALQHGQPSTLAPIEVTDKARIVYLHFKALGLLDSVTFEGFLSVYTLGLDGRPGEREKGAGVNERKYIGKSRLRVGKETKESGNNKKGEWKETLDIISQRLVGRNESARVRASISAAKGNAPFEDPMKIADDRRESLYRMLGSVRKEWEFENKKLMDLDRRKRELGSEIEHKRKFRLLLNVLEKREGFRMKRIGSVGNKGEDSDDGNATIGDLIKGLRTEIIFSSQMFHEALSRVQKPEADTTLTPAALQILERQPRLSYTHSANTIAKLHAYHSRLMRMGTRTSVGPKEDVNKRMENALKILGVRDIQDTKRRLETVARLRAERRRKFNIRGVTDPSVSELHLEELQRTNEQKKGAVQQQLNRAVALLCVCEGYIDLIATFREQTVPGLDNSMAEEQKRLEGYVDKMKMAILGQRRKATGSFSQRARDTMGTSKLKVWEEVDEDLKYSGRKIGDILRSEKDLVVGELDVSDMKRLLDRKKQKAEHGYAMAEEIRGILQGFKKLKYV